jgi:type IV pilus assembly protein PilV
MPAMTPSKPLESQTLAQAIGRRQRGFSLIEVLIAILIFSFGVLGLIGLQAKAIQYSTGAENTNRAALLANEASTMMWTGGTVNLPSASVTAWQARVADPVVGLPGPGIGEIEVQGGVAEIRVKWKAASATAYSQYTTQVTFPP